MDGAQKVVEAMKAILNAKQALTSNIVSLKVKSVNPLIFENEHRLEIDENFYSLSKIENWNQLNVGDVVRAFKMNNGQSYYIQENLNGENSSDNLRNVEETLEDLALTVSSLVQELQELDNRVTALEGRLNE